MSEVYEVEIPQLVLTSEIDLNVDNGKGGVKLEWSNYDIKDKYFVIYRKEEDKDNFETVVSLTDKFNGSSFVDSLGNDNKMPNEPNIFIDGDNSRNDIQIGVSSSDSGTKYVYYIEAYDVYNVLVSVSNQIIVS